MYKHIQITMDKIKISGHTSTNHMSTEVLGIFFQFDVPNAQKLLSDAIAPKSPVQDITFAFFALKNLGLTGKPKLCWIRRP